MEVRDARGPAGTTVEVTCSALEGGTRVDALLRNDSTRTVRVHEVELHVACSPLRVLEHGYQSWSPVRRATVGERVPGRDDCPPWLLPMVRADRSALERADTADHVLLTDEGVVGLLDGTLHDAVLRPHPDGVVVVALLDGVVLEPGEQRPLAPVWLRRDEPGRAWSAYAGLWGRTQGARSTTAVPRLGWCSWYHLETRVGADDVLRAADAGRPHGVDLVAVDDGWATVGDWLTPRAGFPGGTAPVAAALRDRGHRAGIWTAPFVASEHSRLVADQPQWLARDAAGSPVVALHNVHWDGAAYGLDVSREDVLGYLADVYGSLAAEGWTWHKLDFVYGGALPATVRSDPRRTRAQVVHHALTVVREAVGDDAFVLGCGAPLGPSVGLVDGMRVSGDTGADWLPEEDLPAWEGVGAAARTAVSATVLRAAFHRRLWADDGDCVILRGTSMTPTQRAAAHAVAVGAGGLLVLSDDLASLSPAHWEEVAQLQAVADAAEGPFDVVDPFASRIQVRSAGTLLEVDWTAPDPEVSLELQTPPT